MSRIQTQVWAGVAFLLIAGARAEEASFEVGSLVVRQENHLPTVIEWPVKAEVRDSYLTASAEGTCQIPANEKWRVGYVQIVTKVTIKNSYSDAWVEYQFPHLPVNDCTAQAAPFYDDTLLVGDGRKQRFAVTMNDNTATNITWRQPTPPKGDEIGEPDLRQIDREQEFTTWLLAKRDGDKKVVLLKRFSWISSYHAQVDPAAPLGTRVRFLPRNVTDPKVDDPQPGDMDLLKQNHILSATRDSNDIQLFLWHSKKEPSKGIPIQGNFNFYHRE
jgi:hypothetical protein